MNKGVLIGIGTAILLLIIGGVSWLYLPEDPAVIRDEAMPETVPVIVEDETGIDFTSKGMRGLLVLISESEMIMVEDRLKDLFTQSMPAISASRESAQAYYDDNEEAIMETYGIGSAEGFNDLYSKLVRIPDYDACCLSLVSESIMEEDHQFRVNFVATYDKTLDITFYVALDKDDLSIEIH